MESDLLISWAVKIENMVGTKKPSLDIISFLQVIKNYFKTFKKCFEIDMSQVVRQKIFL